MDQEQIISAWRGYLDGQRDSITPPSWVPVLSRPVCGNCRHWKLINAEELSTMVSTPEYDNIIGGLSVGVVRVHAPGTEDADPYSTKVFYGWCKRFPPNPRASYSVSGFRSLFSRMFLKTLLRISDLDFPLVNHENTCGEWKKDQENFPDNEIAA